MSNPSGDWEVSIDDEAPDHIKLSFVEWDEEGAEEFLAYMRPTGAQEFIDAIKDKIDYLNNQSSE